MADYNWQQIFKDKSDEELISIYNGDTSLDFEAEIYAGLELRKRKYNYHIINSIYEQKVIQVKRELEDSHKLNFSRLKYNTFHFHRDFAILVCILFVIKNFSGFFTGKEEFDFRMLYYMGLYVIIASSIIWLFGKLLNRIKRPKINKLILLELLKE